MKIAYRDLKPENVLMDLNGYVSLADFGMAKFIKPDEDEASLCGTPEYLAPEVLSGEDHGIPSDWWALGILM
jgi:serine/threonine protein kinase